MDYDILAREFMEKMQLFQKAKQQKRFNEGLHGETFVLCFISEKQKEGDVIPSDISDAMGLSTARIAAALNSLESKDLITREIDVNDRRQIIVKLTEKGKGRAACHAQRHMQMITNLLTELGEYDAKEYVRITGRLAEIVHKFECENI